MSKSENIKILQGEEAKKDFADRDLIHLVNRVNKIDVDESFGEQRHNIASRIYQTLVGNRDASIRNIDRAFPFINHMKELRDRGDIAIAKDDEKTVGMVGFEHCGIDSASGKNVYEIRRLGVRKEYEGQGIGTQLHRTMLERVKEIDQNALVLIETENPAVVAQCRKMNYKPYPMMNALRMKYGERAEEQLPYYQQQGSEFFVYDLSSKEREHH